MKRIKLIWIAVCGAFHGNIVFLITCLMYFLVCLGYSLFISSEGGNLVWFNTYTLETTVMFQLLGILLGLAIYNGIILDVHFPLLVYKKLLGYSVGLEDLKEIQPTLSNGLNQLIQYDGDVENDFCSTFEVRCFTFESRC